MEIVSLILSISKAVPIVDNWIRLLIDKYIEEQIKGIRRASVSKLEKKEYLLKKITSTKDLNEKAILFSAYCDIDRL